MTILLGSQCDVLTRQLGVAHLRRTEMLQCGVQVVGEVSDLRFERSHVFELSSTTTTRAFSVTQHASLASNIRGICTISRISVAVVLFVGVLRPDRLGGFPSTLRTTLRAPLRAPSHARAPEHAWLLRGARGAACAGFTSRRCIGGGSPSACSHRLPVTLRRRAAASSTGCYLFGHEPLGFNSEQTCTRAPCLRP